jgi:hypothetical protein
MSGVSASTPAAASAALSTFSAEYRISSMSSRAIGQHEQQQVHGCLASAIPELVQRGTLIMHPEPIPIIIGVIEVRLHVLLSWYALHRFNTRIFQAGNWPLLF